MRGNHKDKRQDAASTFLPAAGTFDGWPKTAAELKLLDPCTGSGHFLVAGLHHLVPIRMAEEGLSAREAVDAVLRDNLHGLEIDERCCQIAAFALAFAAWTYPDAGAYRPLPNLHIACTGIGPQSTQEQWVKLAEESGMPTRPDQRERVKNGLLNLHRLFSQAPTLGSLINPTKLPSDVFSAGYETIQPHLAQILSAEKADDETRERAIAAAGMVRAAELLAGEYALVITNVPYLGRGNQDGILREYIEEHYSLGKADLATAFVLRCPEMCAQGGTSALVTPQNWMFLTRYKGLRKYLLEQSTWAGVARVGPGAFETISGHVVNVALVTINHSSPAPSNKFFGLDVSTIVSPQAKATALSSATSGTPWIVSQTEQLEHPDARIVMGHAAGETLLGEYASSIEGLTTGDMERFVGKFWEQPRIADGWECFVQSVEETCLYGGRSDILLWENDAGQLRACPSAHNFPSRIMNGQQILGKAGIRVSQMGGFACTVYTGEVFGKNAATVVPHDTNHLTAVWSFCCSEEFRKAVRRIDKALKVTNATFCKVPFDLARWQNVAVKKYPDGLPESESDDPTQWLFHGYPGGKVEAASSRLNQDTRQDAASTLQVAVARLLGYRWPAEVDDKMRLSKRARALVKRCDELLKFADGEGIVCIPSVRGEEPAAERLLRLLEACGCGILPLLQTAAGSRSHLDLDDWLRNGYFEQHCKLFHDRPFVWHIWDGRKRDGFHALVNYHKLCRVEAASSRLGSSTRQDAASTGRKLLESLTYSYLGEWITRQKDGVKRGEGGAEDRLAAALELQKRLQEILNGEPPFDIFVRWKPLAEQPIGWEPDINAGVRMNIRPFMCPDMPDGRRGADLPGGRTGAGVLRFKPNIKWTKDRGKEPERPKAKYPWFWGWDEKTEDFLGGKTFDGNRWNDCHYANKVKQAAREAAREGQS